MAMFHVGKLKLRFKDGGLDFQLGEGARHRIGFGRKDAMDDADLYPQDYVEGSDTSGLDYNGRFSGADGYAEDDYADEDYREDDYADDGYDYGDDYGDGYDDERYDGYDDGGDYDDGRYAGEDYNDDYDDGYDDERYDDEGYDEPYADGEYEDRYADEDADNGYGDNGYADGGYDYPEGALGSLLQYVDENDWVTYLLLFLLPPLGIYLLWRRRRFDQTVRYAITGASAVWFILLIVLLSMAIFRGGNDIPGDPTLPTPAPTSEMVQSNASPSPSPSVSPSASSGVQPSATPIGGSATASTTGDIVYVTAIGNFYHNQDKCELIASNEAVTQATLSAAQSRGKYACPKCYGGDIYYATSNGRWYHLDSGCSGMSGATVYSKEQAEAEGKTACPVCVTKQRDSIYNTDNVVFITTSTTDKSGVRVWCTQGGVNYHMTRNCRKMSGASQVSLKEALLMGKTACATCCAAAGELYWCTKGGTYYHAVNDCSSMQNAKQVTLAEAMVLGKKKCNTCMAETGQPDGNSTEPTTYEVYATPNGKWYHLNSTCNGMQGAVRVPLSLMVQMGREPCPDCCAGANMTVYAARGGTYYHSYATCSGMQNGEATTLAQALAVGYRRCPRCWGENGESNGGDNAGSGEPTADNIQVYATRNGRYYHTVDSCSGISSGEVFRGPLRLAIEAGKTACPNCAAAAQMMIYSTDGGKYYHKVDGCSNMTGARRRTLADALMLGQQRCPVCWNTEDLDIEGDPQGNSEKVGNFEVGKSGIKVYAAISVTEPYFHTQSNCSGRTGLVQVPLEMALNYGKTACPDCASAAATTVYATRNGRYYHLSQSCAGQGAVAGTLANALAYGFSACPYCVTGAQTAPTQGGFTIGTSGIKVYATVDGAYYHSNQSHAGNGASQVTLETALNYGKRACPDCCAIAERTVYAVPGSSYYHANRSCAGDNAVAGTFAQALAYGLQPCPNCIGSVGNLPNVTTPNGGEEYSQPASTVVYVDLYSDQFYYHKSRSCPGAGMTNGTQETLEFAKDLGYFRCPYCNPPSSIG